MHIFEGKSFKDDKLNTSKLIYVSIYQSVYQSISLYLYSTVLTTTLAKCLTDILKEEKEIN